VKSPLFLFVPFVFFVVKHELPLTEYNPISPCRGTVRVLSRSAAELPIGKSMNHERHEKHEPGCTQ